MTFHGRAPTFHGRGPTFHGRGPAFHPLRGALLLLILWLSSTQPAPAQAQPAPPWPAAAPPGGVLIQLGLEPHLVVSLGYLWGVSTGDSPTNVGIGTGLKLSPYDLRDGAARLNLIVAGQWQPDERWGATGTTQLYLARGRNPAATTHGLGMEVRVAPGYHGDRWSTAADLGWQGTLLTHFRHGRAAKESFDERYPEGADSDGGIDGPVDGWYGSTAHRFRIGVLTTRSISEGLDVQAGIGSLFSIQRQGIRVGFAHGQVPAYLEASVRMAR